MAFCAITDENIKGLEAVTNAFLSKDIERLSDFKTLSKELYNFFIERKATPEKAVTLLSMVPKTLEKWRDYKSEIGDPIDKKYRDFINDISKLSKSTLNSYNSILNYLDLAPPEEEIITEIIPVSDNQDNTLKEIDNFTSSTKAEIVEVKNNDGKFIKRRSINGVIYDIRVTDISTVGYYETSDEQEENDAPSLKHGNTVDRIAKEIFSGNDIQFSNLKLE